MKLNWTACLAVFIFNFRLGHEISEILVALASSATELWPPTHNTESESTCTSVLNRLQVASTQKKNLHDSATIDLAIWPAQIQ